MIFFYELIHLPSSSGLVTHILYGVYLDLYISSGARECSQLPNVRLRRKYFGFARFNSRSHGPKGLAMEELAIFCKGESSEVRGGYDHEHLICSLSIRNVEMV